ncbi:alpha/beta hydrolase [Deinococcus detaillensis]|uniref:Alpha/beta hydrolase n=1 Tax=Deinococcus detaillensis TaxID=2592048 RepID=A0A553V5J4_9DEIO|nr:alpha/beta hydrolase [Deinococcus detaillensis]
MRQLDLSQLAERQSGPDPDGAEPANRRRLDCRVAGVSEPRLVLVHGFGTSAHLWRRVRAGLAAEPLTPDLMGFGDAAALGQLGQTTGDMAEQLAGILKAAGGGPFKVVGHSMGGKVVLLLAARFPSLVSELLLVAPSPSTPEPMTEEGRAELRSAHGDSAALDAQQKHITLERLAEPDRQQFIKDGQRASRDAWQAWPDVGSREDVSGEISGLTLPIQVLFSEDDPAIDADTIRSQVLANLPQARATAVRGCGHLMPLEAPQHILAALNG